jgi:outer membrane biosynthesis protein TonB
MKQIDEYDEDKSFFQRYGLWIGVGVVVLVSGLIYALSSGKSAPKRVEQKIAMITLPPPPPPPPKPTPPPQPTPPPPEPKDTPKMEQQESVQDVKKEETPEPPKAEPPSGAVGTAITGDGPPDGFGVAAGGNGMGFGPGTTGTGDGKVGGNRGGKFGWYASQVQVRLADALRKNPHTRSANLQLEVRIWSDATGRITRVKLTRSTGDKALDDVICNEVLTGLQLQEPPPDGMLMPIVLRMSARRPT